LNTEHFSLSNTSALDEMEGHRFAISDRRDDARLFARARKHSRRVRILRIAIPAILVLTLGITVFVSWFDPLKILVRLPGEAGRLIISGTKITMEAPKLTGYTKDQRWYELSARAAAQDITKPNAFELYDVRAKVEAEDKSQMLLSAKLGWFDRKTGILTLKDDIVLKSSRGEEIRLSEASVDTGSGEIISNQPVEVQTAQAKLNAQRMEVINSGEVIRFIGNVVMNLSEMGATGSLPVEKR
jgi:lipopolysaccharide export system protein LptC